MKGRLSFFMMLLTLLTSALVGGCGPAGRLRLAQPHLGGYQREVEILSEQVRWAQSEEVDRVLAEFPLPGARSGRPTYLFYLRMPAGAEKARFDAPADTPRAQGFLIQTHGEYAGLTRISAGQVEMVQPFMGGASARRIRLDASCDDGTHLAGKLEATRDDYFIGRFETHLHPADVQNLVKAIPAATSSKPGP